jgi:hypothetical protein
MYKIKLQSHDGTNNYLEELEGRPNKYKLVTPYDFLRGGYIGENQHFVDPSGGPMIVEGKELVCYGDKSYIVENISSEKGIGCIITLKENL